MIPVILKGETSKPIQLTLREGYVYSGCVLAVCFRGVMKTFTDLVAGGTVELLYTAEETSTFPLGTGKVGLSIQNSAGDICFMPWAKIKVTDSPAEVHDAQITIDPETLNVSDATSKDSLGAVKSKLNAVLAFLRGLSSLAVLALPLYALSDVAPLYSAFEDIPGDEQVVTNVVPYVDAKVTAATNALVIAAADFSTSNALLVATIEAVAPAPGNYANVSNAAMIAGRVATNYADWAVVRLAQTNSVLSGGPYVTPSGMEEYVTNALSGIDADRITDGTNAIYSTLAYSQSVAVNGTWEVNGTPLTQTVDRVYSNIPLAPTVGDYSYTLGFADADETTVEASFAVGVYDPYGNWQFVYASTLVIPADSTSFTMGDYNFRYPYTYISESRIALTNDISQAISTNNPAFVSAVLSVPLTGADAGDLAEIAEYGGYGTVGAAILALIAGLAALKRRVGTAETALAQKASLTDLPYRLVEPGVWEFSGDLTGFTSLFVDYNSEEGQWFLDYVQHGSPGQSDGVSGNGSELSVAFSHSGESWHITATRPSLPDHLCDRSGNRVVVSGDTTLTLPAAVPGYLRDFLVRLEISGSTVPTITFSAPTGETIVYETDGDEFPVPDEAGNWLYSFTEDCVAHTFAVSLKKVNVVAQGGS